MIKYEVIYESVFFVFMYSVRFFRFIEFLEKLVLFWYFVCGYWNIEDCIFGINVIFILMGYRSNSKIKGFLNDFLGNYF